MGVAYRAAEQTDLEYILDTWLRGARKAERHSFMSNQDYFLYYRNHIINTLASCFLRVAYDDEAKDVIIAWMAYNVGTNGELVIHYIYTRKMLWKMEIATGLVKDVFPEVYEKPVIATTLCEFHRDLAKKHPNFKYNPYFMEPYKC